MAALTITKENFKTEVLESSKPILLDFWAGWCRPCRMLAPVLDEIASETPEALVGKINIDEQPELAAAFQVMSIPTLAVVKGGKVVDSMVGVRPKAAIMQMLAL